MAYEVAVCGWVRGWRVSYFSKKLKGFQAQGLFMILSWNNYDFISQAKVEHSFYLEKNPKVALFSKLPKNTSVGTSMNSERTLVGQTEKGGVMAIKETGLSAASSLNRSPAARQ